MANKFKLNTSGVNQLMRSKEMQTVLSERAKEVKERCGDGYEQDIFVGRTRANASVKAKTHKAKRDNLKNNTLLKAVH